MQKPTPPKSRLWCDACGDVTNSGHTNRICKFLHQFTDPVKYCNEYKTNGCVHVDGPICVKEICTEYSKMGNIPNQSI